MGILWHNTSSSHPNGRENVTSILANEGQYDDRFGIDCDAIPNCDILTQFRVFQPGDLIPIPRNSDIIFVAEGKYRPINMTIKIQQFSLEKSNITDT